MYHHLGWETTFIFGRKLPPPNVPKYTPQRRRRTLVGKTPDDIINTNKYETTQKVELYRNWSIDVLKAT